MNTTQTVRGQMIASDGHAVWFLDHLPLIRPAEFIHSREEEAANIQRLLTTWCAAHLVHAVMSTNTARTTHVILPCFQWRKLKSDSGGEPSPQLTPPNIRSLVVLLGSDTYMNFHQRMWSCCQSESRTLDRCLTPCRQGSWQS